jgi:hypothetical protein
MLHCIHKDSTFATQISNSKVRLLSQMADASGDGKMVAPPYPSNERMKQHDEVSPLV